MLWRKVCLCLDDQITIVNLRSHILSTMKSQQCVLLSECSSSMEQHFEFLFNCGCHYVVILTQYDHESKWQLVTAMVTWENWQNDVYRNTESKLSLKILKHQHKQNRQITSSGMWYLVAGNVVSDVSKDQRVFLFEASSPRRITLKMKPLQTFITLQTAHPMTHSYILEPFHRHQYCSENLTILQSTEVWGHKHISANSGNTELSN
jgi:hypothetical protein